MISKHEYLYKFVGQPLCIVSWKGQQLHLSIKTWVTYIWCNTILTRSHNRARLQPDVRKHTGHLRRGVTESYNFLWPIWTAIHYFFTFLIYNIFFLVFCKPWTWCWQKNRNNLINTTLGIERYAYPHCVNRWTFQWF